MIVKEGFDVFKSLHRNEKRDTRVCEIVISDVTGKKDQIHDRVDGEEEDIEPRRRPEVSPGTIDFQEEIMPKEKEAS